MYNEGVWAFVTFFFVFTTVSHILKALLMNCSSTHMVMKARKRFPDAIDSRTHGVLAFNRGKVVFCERLLSSHCISAAKYTAGALGKILNY